jgi:hypothetical protein
MSLDAKIDRVLLSMGLTAKPDSYDGKRYRAALKGFFLDIHGIAVETYSAALAAYVAEKLKEGANEVRVGTDDRPVREVEGLADTPPAPGADGERVA